MGTVSRSRGEPTLGPGPFDVPLSQHRARSRALIAYIVARAREREITLTRTRLVKLLYLLDVERIRSRREPVHRRQLGFLPHYGPYAFELIDTLEQMEGSELVAQSWRGSILYRAAPGAPDGEDWVSATGARWIASSRAMRRSGRMSCWIASILRLAPWPRPSVASHWTCLSPETTRGHPPNRLKRQNVQRMWNRDWSIGEHRPHADCRPHRLNPPGRLLEDHREDLGGVAGAENVRARLHVPDGSEL